jgi:hypothetical protein
MRYLCPSRHSYASIAWDDDQSSVAQARDQLGEFVAEAAEKHGTEVPVCLICGSTAFTAEDGRTRYRSMIDAVPVILLEGIAQHESLIMNPRRN